MLDLNGLLSFGFYNKSYDVNCIIKLFASALPQEMLGAFIHRLLFSGSDYNWKDGRAEQITAKRPLLFSNFP